jgi:hypothetical protein
MYFLKIKRRRKVLKMKSKWFFCFLVFLGLVLSGCDNGTGTDSNDITGGGNNDVPKTTFTRGIPDLDIQTTFTNNGTANANYYLTWTSVTGSIKYNVYRATERTGDGYKMEEIDSTDELIYSAREMGSNEDEIRVVYYWVTSTTLDGETNRPSNGGVKVTYTFVKKERSLDPFTGQYNTTKDGSVTHVVDQNGS